MPLRPLALGDMYDGAVRTIRASPRATVGSAVLVAAVAMAIPVLATTLLVTLADLSLDVASLETAESGADLLGLAASYGSLLVGLLVQSVGLVLVTGIVARVVAAGVTGRRLGLGEAWAATRGRRWRLIALTTLLGLLRIGLVALYVLSYWPMALALESPWLLVLYGLVTVPVLLAVLAWVGIRVCYLAVPALMLEQVGVLGAVRRGFVLTRRQFWRTFGIWLLTFVVAQVAGAMLAVPVSLLVDGVVLGGIPARWELVAVIGGQAIGTVLTTAVVAPFTASVVTLQYLDQRMRKEGFDVELLSRAGLATP